MSEQAVTTSSSVEADDERGIHPRTSNIYPRSESHAEHKMINENDHYFNGDNGDGNDNGDNGDNNDTDDNDDNDDENDNNDNGDNNDNIDNNDERYNDPSDDNGNSEDNDDNDDNDDESKKDDEDYDAISILNEVEGISPSGKRKYNYIKRKRRITPSPHRQTDWLSTLDSMSEPKLRRMSCCKRMKCFRNVPYDYYVQRCRHINSSSSSVRKTILTSMIDADKNFIFNGKPVCVRFMKKSFHFSTEFLARDRRQIEKEDLGGEQISANNYLPAKSSSSSSTPENLYRTSPHRDAILSFLIRLGEDCSEKMPDKSELHLPFFQKKEVYSLFVSEYKKLYSDSEPTSHYFMTIWKHNCRHIKVRKATRFTICDTCEEIRSGMKEALVSGSKMDHLLNRRSIHLKMVNDERMEYQKKKDRARLNPSEYCSIIIDGADQRAYGLPHFVTKTKEQKGLAMKLKVIGLLEHDLQNVLHIFTMTEEHETGANHVVECIHRFLNSRRNRGVLPRILFVQMDNCTRENKNRYLLSYLESLVSLDLFDVVEAGFLPKGHTHEDVDQCFSQSSCRLKHKNAFTILQMHKELSQINRGKTEVSHVKRIVNWSGLCDTERCVQGINNFTQYRYFKFSRSFQEEAERTAPYSTTCHVRLNCYENWRSLCKARKNQKCSGFLKFCPDLRKVPPLKIKCAEGKDKVLLRLISEEGRINNSDVMLELHELKNFVFQARVDQFHWDLSSTIETSRCELYNGTVDATEEDPAASDGDGILDVDDEISPLHIQNGEQEATIEAGTSVNHQNNSTGSTVPADLNQIRLARNTHMVRDRAALQPSSKFTYVLGSFVAVQPDTSEAEDGEGSSQPTFWVGKILSLTKKANESFARKLRIHWYSPNKIEDPLQSEYYPLYEAKSKKTIGGNARKLSRKELKTPWTDDIDTDAVLVSFSALTKKQQLPFSVRRKLST